MYSLTVLVLSRLTLTVLVTGRQIFFHTRKIPKYSDTRKNDVIILKFEQCGSTIQ